MKKIIFSTCLFLFLSINSNGQWYVKKYNVANVDFLSREQLDESLKTSKNELLYSGIISVAGVGVFLAGRYLPYEIDDESSFIEQLIGEKGMKNILMVTGAGIFTGGAIAGIVYLGRIGRIKSVINEYYTFNGTLKISPVIIVNTFNKSVVPGFTMTYDF
ncbi:MAG: hypothetical protein A2V50_02850 [Bacteroidetes bacterium RBG_19FT_COMBO_42_10]|nr:MAG: hypothetical protein A2V50_02850 [Bacteroidetes bacterium RBG_19FT_COMBO_42_10]